MSKAPKLRFKEFKDAWDSDFIGNVAKVTSGGTPNRNIKQYWDGGNIPWITTSLIDSNVIDKAEEFISEEGVKNSSAKIFPVGTILMAMYGQGKTRGKVSLLGIEATTNQACAAILVNEKLSSLYLFQNLGGRYEEIRGLSNEGGQQNLSGDIIKKIKIRFPSLPEQQKIASFLSAVDEKIQQLTRKKEWLEQYKKGVMQQLFSGKLRFKDPNGKPYPKWEEKRLGEVVELQHGYQFRTADFTRSGLAVIKIGNVIGNSLNLDDLSFISADRYDEFQRFEIHKGDILMSLTGNIGRVVEVSEVPFKIIQNYRVGKFVPYDLYYLTKSFVKYLLISDMVFGRFNQLSNQSAQANFGKQDMDKINVQIPSIGEQQKIASFLTALDAKIESVASQISHTQTFKKGLLQQMFV